MAARMTEHQRTLRCARRACAADLAWPDGQPHKLTHKLMLIKNEISYAKKRWSDDKCTGTISEGECIDPQGDLGHSFFNTNSRAV